MEKRSVDSSSLYEYTIDTTLELISDKDTIFTVLQNDSKGRILLISTETIEIFIIQSFFPNMEANILTSDGKEISLNIQRGDMFLHVHEIDIFYLNSGIGEKVNSHIEGVVNHTMDRYSKIIVAIDRIFSWIN